MIKLFYKLLFLVPIPIIVVCLNYIVDPANLYNSEYERGLSQLLISGNNVANVYNYDEEILQKYYIEANNDQKQIIAVGSSRSMKIGAEVLCNQSFFNHSVSGANLEDYIAIYSIYKQKAVVPNEIVIGIDPWVFKDHGSNGYFSSIREHYYMMLRDIDPENDDRLGLYYELALRKHYTELLSPSYFQASIKLIKKRYINESSDEYYVTTEKIPNEDVVKSDGSRLTGDKTRKTNPKDIAEGVNASIMADSVYYLEQFDAINTKRVKLFERFISALAKDGVEITFFLPPYHPLMYEYVTSSGKYNIVTEVEQYIREFSNDNNIIIIGSFNPNKAKMTSHDFYDGIHPKREGIQKVFDTKCLN